MMLKSRLPRARLYRCPDEIPPRAIREAEPQLIPRLGDDPWAPIPNPRRGVKGATSGLGPRPDITSRHAWDCDRYHYRRFEVADGCATQQDGRQSV